MFLFNLSYACSLADFFRHYIYTNCYKTKFSNLTTLFFGNATNTKLEHVDDTADRELLEWYTVSENGIKGS
jgi:hypothetical protein